VWVYVRVSVGVEVYQVPVGVGVGVGVWVKVRVWVNVLLATTGRVFVGVVTTGVLVWLQVAVGVPPVTV
jgi:hypothetical protein